MGRTPGARLASAIAVHLARPRIAIAFLALLAGCAGGPEEADEGGPGGKADDAFDAAELVDGTPPAIALLRFVNDPATTVEVLDDEVDLPSDAARNLVADRPFDTVAEVDAVPRVGEVALQKLLDFAIAHGYLPEGEELGIVSDLDSTIIPPAPSGQEFPDAPYAGVAELLTILELGDGSGAAGDVHFVTAREPSAVTEVPAWLAEHGVPAGDISTGVSGIPTLARNEKIRDITAVLEASPGQAFVLFGDSNHVDPDVYRAIRAAFEGRVAVAFIHDVKAIDPARLEGLFLIDHYAEAAAELFRLRLLTEAQARSVMQAVVDGGEITQDELEQLIAGNQP